MTIVEETIVEETIMLTLEYLSNSGMLDKSVCGRDGIVSDIFDEIKYKLY